MPGGIRPAAGPVDEKRLAGVIQPVVAAAGMDLESVRVVRAGKQRELRVVVDADGGVTLDDTADLSHEISALLDAVDAMGEGPYSLTVSSPGIERPLTLPKHWRRAARRLVRVKVAGEGTVTGRVVATDDGGVTLDVEGARRAFEYGALGPGAIQVEFGRLPDLDEDVADDEPDPDELSDDEEPAELDGDHTNHGGDLDNNKTDLGAGGDGH
jgi:ribosome maturation factor RimP